MRTWEYMVWLVGFAHPTETDFIGHHGGRVKFVNGERVKNWETGATLPAWLGQAGAEGWELIGFHLPRSAHTLGNSAERGDAVFVFKREKT